MTNPVYFTKERAAKVSGLSVRRIQELAKAGEIRRHYQRDENTNRNVALYLAEDVAAVIKRRTNGINKVLAPWVPQQQQQPVAPTTQWLTLADAALYSGLPESFLRDLIEYGKLPAFDVGVRPGGRYRVSRKALDALEGRAFIGRHDAKKRIGKKRTI